MLRIGLQIYIYIIIIADADHKSEYFIKSLKLIFEAGKNYTHSHAHIWSNFGSIMPNPLNIPKTHILGVLLTAIGLLNSYIKFHPDSTENG